MKAFNYNPDNAESPVRLLPEGPYQFTVVDVREEISKGNTTSGSTVWKLKLQCVGAGGKSIVYDDLIEHANTEWRLNQLIKATGMFQRAGAVMLDRNAFLGVRGHCHIYQDEYQGKVRNKVSHYIIGERPLERVVVEAPKQVDPFA